MSWKRKLRNTVKKSFTVKGLISNAKNLSGIGLLQRSKTARKAFLVAGAVVGSIYAAPYAAALGKSALAGAGKLGGAALSSGSSLLKSLYKPPMNGPGPQPVEESQQDAQSTDLQSQLYGAESSVMEAQITTERPLFRTSGLPMMAGAGAPAGCASTGGSVDEIGFYAMVATYLTIGAVVVCVTLWRRFHARKTAYQIDR